MISLAQTGPSTLALFPNKKVEEVQMGMPQIMKSLQDRQLPGRILVTRVCQSAFLKLLSWTLFNRGLTKSMILTRRGIDHPKEGVCRLIVKYHRTSSAYLLVDSKT